MKQKKAKFAMHLLGNKKLDEELAVLGAWLTSGGREGGRRGTIKGMILNRMSRNVVKGYFGGRRAGVCDIGGTN